MCFSITSSQGYGCRWLRSIRVPAPGALPERRVFCTSMAAPSASFRIRPIRPTSLLTSALPIGNRHRLRYGCHGTHVQALVKRALTRDVGRDKFVWRRNDVFPAGVNVSSCYSKRPRRKWLIEARTDRWLRLAGLVLLDPFLDPRFIDSRGVDGRLFCDEPFSLD